MSQHTWTLDANESGSWIELALLRDKPVSGFLHISGGSFGGGTITMESRPVGGSTAAAVNGAAFTAAESGQFVAHPGMEYRPTLAGATGPGTLTVVWSYF